MLSFDPTRADARVILSRANDPSDVMSALYNPNELSLAVSVDIGKLKPIGWSHSVLMYGGTDSLPIPLKFYFSAIGMLRIGRSLFTNITEAMNWLTSFCYAPSVGRSPSKLLLIWPTILYMEVVVGGVTQGHAMFDAKLKTRIAEATMQCIEIRKYFKTSLQQAQNGFIGQGHPTSNDPTTGTGSSLNLGGR